MRKLYTMDKERSRNRKISHNLFVIILLLSLYITSCENFVDIDAPTKELSPALVFSNDQSAEAAVLGIYTDLWELGYDEARFTGRSADEFKNFSPALDDGQFFFNQLTEDNVEIENLWRKLYKPIYGANALIEGLASSTEITTKAKGQLEGEARFLRAFCYFQLINLFGDVPLIKVTDFRTNAVEPRSSVDDVYELIVEDLIQAEDLLMEDYPTGEKVRANKFSVIALLSRVYLYLENWEEAEESANKVIGSGKYTLDDVAEVFLANSDEAILQFYPVENFFNTREGSNFILTYTPPQAVAFTDQFINSFETDDLRIQNWVAAITDESEGTTYYYPFKYKVGFTETNTKTEYVLVLRLAEQYLIRAEARAQQNKLTEAVSDVDVIRSRANLVLVQDINPGISQADLLMVIEQERRAELFTEWAHRWFDLKRTKRAETILSPLKTDWQNTDQLYPVPLRERNTNRFLNQNLGY